MAKWRTNGLKALNPGNPVRTARRLIGYIFRDYGKRFVVVLLGIMIAAAASVTGSLFLRTLIDRYIAPLEGMPDPDLSGLLGVILIMAAVYYLGVAATFTQSQLMVTISQGVQKTIRDQLFARMEALPISFFDSHSHGDLMSTYTNDIDTLRQMLSQSLPQVFSSVVTMLVVFIAMLHVSATLAILVTAILIIAWIASRMVGSRSAVFFVRQQASLGALNGFLEEMVHGQKEVKVFNYEDRALDRFDALNDDLCRSATSANKYANILMPLMVNIGNLQFVLVAVLGGALAASDRRALSVGAIASFLQLSRSFSMPLNQLSQQINSIVMALAGAERIFTLMDEKPEADQGYVTLVNAEERDGTIVPAEHRTGRWAWRHPHGNGEITYTPLTGDVQFVDVTFGYVPEKTVLFDITLEAHAGEKMAFVGSTGAGKTTITNLINRFYDIQGGKIRYDGINIEKIRKADLRRSLGMVLQETTLFTGSIRDNIRYGRLEASDAEVKAAAELANADDFINLLPDGYDTVLTDDGGELSQGQKQLLAIARAAVADPPVMILDEATSSIDTRTEAIVQAGMDSLMHGRTVFVIAHRLSTVRNADMIMVLEHGRIIERGSHRELLAAKGVYYRLYTGASELQ
ncbi:MAG: ABC transporter ATP-binding protein/permease [Planctomycetes bacterium]|nr:ABC transporter ATP-binding protein/permease [Planctomycetota bacterium]